MSSFEGYVRVTQSGVNLLFLGCQKGDVVSYGDVFKLWRDLDTMVSDDPFKAYATVVRPTLFITDHLLMYASPTVYPTVVAYFV